MQNFTLWNWQTDFKLIDGGSHAFLSVNMRIVLGMVVVLGEIFFGLLNCIVGVLFIFEASFRLVIRPLIASIFLWARIMEELVLRFELL